MPEPIITLRRVSVARGERIVLHDISLNVHAGEQLAILGPNGCGKSTLLKTLTCELYPIVGPETAVQIFGRSRWDVTELRRRLGVVSAEPVPRAMLPLPGLEAVITGFFSSTRLWPNLEVTEGMRARALTLLSRVHAGHLGDKAVGIMSSGEQRKIIIARALAASSLDHAVSGTATPGKEPIAGPEVLLLDEPSNSLDLAAQRDLYAALRQLAQTGTTILLITHHVADIIPEMHRVLLMKDGRVYREGSRAESLTSAVLSELFGTAATVVEREGLLTAY